MKLSRILLVVGAGIAAVVTAVVVYAQLDDSQTAAGTINATTTSADLYICEPGGTPPACGPDDSGADETIFETLEDIRPGEVVEWALRLTNVGTVDWTVTGALLTVTETTDPGGDCPNPGFANALGAGVDPVTGFDSFGGVFILGKAGDSQNDNPTGVSGVPLFRRNASGATRRNIFVAVGDYEDVMLRLQLPGVGTENCDGNEWTVTWTFTVS